MARTADQLVQQEVIANISQLVATLATLAAAVTHGRDQMKALCDLAEQAQELAAPIDDWEEAAIQAGWSLTSSAPTEWRNPAHDGWRFATARAVCEHFDLEPYDREVYEHWIVSDWLADKLEAKGEKVDRDFAGLTVWARTTTGQAISLDYVVESIVADLAREYGK